MLSFIIVSIVFGSIVALTALLCGTVLLIKKMRHNDDASRERSREETGTIQEIYQGLSKMESRIEALEIILAENIKNKRQTEKQNNEGEKI